METNFVDVESDSDSEVFFGVATEREHRRHNRLANRRTEVYRPGFRLDSSFFNDSLNEPTELESSNETTELESSNSSANFVTQCEVESYENIVAKFEHLKLISESDGLDSNTIDFKENLNDSLELNRRRSKSFFVSNTESVDKEQSQSDNETEEDIAAFETSVLTRNEDHVAIESKSSIVVVDKCDSLSLGDISQDLIDCSLLKHCDSDDFVEIDDIENVFPVSESSDPSFRSLHMSDLCHNLSDEEATGSHRQMDFVVQTSADRSKVVGTEEFRTDIEKSVPSTPTSLKLSDLARDSVASNQNREPLVQSDKVGVDVSTLAVENGNNMQQRDKDCQTSFIVPMPIATPTSAAKQRKILGTLVVPQFRTPSRLPRPIKPRREDGKELAKPAAFADSASGKCRNRFPTITSTAPKNKKKFAYIRSPIAAYINDAPPPSMIQNVKSQMSNKLKINSQSKVPPVSSPLRLSRVDAIAAAQNVDNLAANEEDNNNENVPSLPFRVCNGSRPISVLQKNWDRVTHLHTAQNTQLGRMGVPSPNVPLIMRHTGQHKRIQWAKKLVSDSQVVLSSPNHPSGMTAPPILLKSFDMESSVVDGPNTVDTSIVDVVSFGRTNI